MSDAKNRFVANPINRYSVGDRSGLVPNADGSVDIYIQNTAPPHRPLQRDAVGRDDILEAR